MSFPRITVIGADDPLGEAVVREALVRGRTVTATAPLPDRLPQLSPALRLVPADPHSRHDLLPAVRGGDAVVLALSPRPAPERTMRLTDAAIATVRAMREAGVTRLVTASSTELNATAPAGGASALRSLTRPVQQRRHHGGLEDLRRLEQLLAGSGTDWTVLRAGRLHDQLATRRQRVVPLDAGGSRILSREDLARALLDQAGHPGARPRRLAVAVGEQPLGPATAAQAP